MEKWLPCAGSSLPGLRACASSSAADVVQFNRPCAKENQGECDRGQSEGEFGSAVAGKSILEVDLPDCDRHVDEHCNSNEPGQQPNDHQHAAAKLRRHQRISQPTRQAKVGYIALDMGDPGMNLLISMGHH